MADLKFRRGMSQIELDEFVARVVSETNLNEKIDAMHGTSPSLVLAWNLMVHGNLYHRPYEAGAIPRFGVPPLRFVDGPRGVGAGRSTCFPVAIARAATWNVELEGQVGDAIGRECRANGATFFGGVCINVLTHPAGGRAQESYGESPHLLGAMGATLVRAVQRHNVMACIKHFAMNNIEDTRFRVNVLADERTIREVYLPHFRKCIEAGAASVMAAYNSVRGAWCCENEYLLSTILKDEWGFKGFVMSDFSFGVRSGVRAANAGLDVEMPGGRHFTRRKLGRAVRDGRVATKRIDDAVRRIISVTTEYANREDPESYHPDLIACSEHTSLARRVAEEGIVLLKNDAVDDVALLPLGSSGPRHIAVLGRIANSANIGDHGSSRVHPPYVVTAAEGIRNEAERRGMTVTVKPRASANRAAEIASRADAAIVIVGMGHRDEGEGGFRAIPMGGDRPSLALHDADVKLIQAVSRVNSRTIVVLVGGSAITVDPWEGSVPAILMAWYPGMEGGTALSRILFGEVNPSGRLPFAVPYREEDLPEFDHRSNEVHYGYFHGHEYLDMRGIPARFAFGFGLSYTTIEYTNLAVTRAAGEIVATVSVSNTGTRAGACVVHAYIGWPESAVERPVRRLYAFDKVWLEPGDSIPVDLSVPEADLRYFEEASRSWVSEPGALDVFVGPWNEETVLLTARV